MVVLGPFGESIDQTRSPMCAAARYALGHQDGHPKQTIFVRASTTKSSIALFKFDGGDPQQCHTQGALSYCIRQTYLEICRPAAS